MAQETLAEWTPTILTKFIRDLFQNQPPDFLPNLTGENITANSTLTIKDKVVLTKEPSWRLVGATGQPAFANSWANYGFGWAPAAFWRDPFGWVHLRGLIKSGTTTAQITVFTLPPGFRPASGGEVFPLAANGAFAYGQVLSTGEVQLTGASATWTTLNGIRFRTS